LNPSDASRNLTVKLDSEEEFKKAEYLVPEVCSQETSKISIKGEPPHQLFLNIF